MKIKCKKCNMVIQGDNKGTYIQCECGAVAIDQTPHYTRIIGNPEDWAEYFESSPNEDDEN